MTFSKIVVANYHIHVIVMLVANVAIDDYEELMAKLKALDRELDILDRRRTLVVNKLQRTEGWKQRQSKPPSTMQMVRTVLEETQQELTTAEIRDALSLRFRVSPAPSLATMLFREGSKRRSGICRSVGPDKVGRYGLLTWDHGERVPG